MDGLYNRLVNLDNLKCTQERKAMKYLLLVLVVAVFVSGKTSASPVYCNPHKPVSCA